MMYVFIGGGMGSLCRYGIALLTQPLQWRFPWATLAANVLACAVLGFVLGMQMQGQMPERWRLLLATGFCGGFSTFSTFTADVWQLLQNGQYALLCWNVLGNFALCFLALILGMKAAG